MTRVREISPNGVYHVIVKGNNKCDVFCDDEDNLKFLYILRDMQMDGRLDCYAYCLMGNHAHLILRFKKESISDVMMVIMLRYVKWYNQKYDRTGRLFENRYFSKPITTTKYLLAGINYIYNNPVKAGICKNAGDYRWSSYRLLRTYVPGLSELTEGVKQLPIQDELDDILCQNYQLDYFVPKPKLTDSEARELVKETTQLAEWRETQDLSKNDINLCISVLLENGANVKQICRVLGVTRYNVKKFISEYDL